MPAVDGVAASIAAGATVNLFQGRMSEFPGGGGGGQAVNETLFLTADALGVTVSMQQNVGSTPLAPIQSGTTVNVASAAGAGPKLDEDGMGTYAVPPNARQSLNVTNTTGAAIIVRYRNYFTP